MGDRIPADAPRYNIDLRVSYFWTQVNRPITALTLSTTPTQIIEMRENLGQIESRGVAFDAETSPLRWLSLIGGYQYADATVTKFAPAVAVACGTRHTGRLLDPAGGAQYGHTASARQHRRSAC